ncbi:putative leucine-rich repeat-containing protein DDB_G0290503 isoform X3 [Centruroides vittatus]|uniref:putative leucine-rich repeat-containing protein DDB_G0290503 isoform X3 n=1 Tax=Centruroides vittatus TaxID=120091 RepID=UPI0035107381
MPKPRKRRTTVSSEEKSVKDDESVIDTQRSSADAEIQKNSEVSSSNDVSSPATKRAKLGKIKDRQYDRYCWICHKEDGEQKCSLCPRIYHVQCVNREKICEEDWMCPECLNISLSDKKSSASPILAMLTTEQFCSLLKYTLHRMKIHVPEDFNIDNPSSVVYPMDFNILEKNIRKKAYTTTASFLADVKWILHNHITCSSHGMPIIKTILKVCQEELREIETCPDCYLHAYSMKDKWFSEPCRKPHTLVWAKLKGFPIWPAKAVKSANGNVDVRFFGGHERAWVPVGHVYFLSRDPPQAITSQKKNFEIAIQEVDLHIKLLTQRFGGYEYALEKTPFIATQLYLHLNITLNKLCCNPQSSRDKRKYEMPSVSSKRRSSKSQEPQGIKKDGQKKEESPEQDISEQDVLEKVGESETASVAIVDTKLDESSEDLETSTVQSTSLAEDDDEIEKANTLTVEESNVTDSEVAKQTLVVEVSVENKTFINTFKEHPNKVKSSEMVNSEVKKQHNNKDSEFLESNESNTELESDSNFISKSEDLEKFQKESNFLSGPNEPLGNADKLLENSGKDKSFSTDTLKDDLNENTENFNKSKENNVMNSEMTAVSDSSSEKPKSVKSNSIDQENKIIQNEENSSNNSLICGTESKKLNKNLPENKEADEKLKQFNNVNIRNENDKINRKDDGENVNLSSKLNEAEHQKKNMDENDIEKETTKNTDLIENNEKVNSDSKDTQKSQSPNSLRIRIVKGKVESKPDLQNHSNKTSNVKSSKLSKKCEFTISRSNSFQNNCTSHKEKLAVGNADQEQVFTSKSKTESIPSLAVRKSKRPRKNFIIQFPWKIMSKLANPDEDTNKSKENLSDDQKDNTSENKSSDTTHSVNNIKEQNNSLNENDLLPDKKNDSSPDKKNDSLNSEKNKELSKPCSSEKKDEENVKDSTEETIPDTTTHKESEKPNNEDEIKNMSSEDLSKSKVSENSQDSAKIQISSDMVISKTHLTEKSIDSLKVKILEDTIDVLRPQVILDNIAVTKLPSSQTNVDLSKKQINQNLSELSKPEMLQEKCLKNTDSTTNIIHQNKHLELSELSKDKVIQIKSLDSSDLLKTVISQNKSSDSVDIVKIPLLQDKSTVPTNSLKTVIVLDKFMDKPLDTNSLKNKICQEKKAVNFTGKSKFVHPSTILEKLDKVKIAKSPLQQNNSVKKQDSFDVQKTSIQTTKGNNSSVFSHIAKILGQPTNKNLNNSCITTSVKSPAISVLSIPKSAENTFEGSVKKSVHSFNKNTNSINTTQINNISNQEIEIDHCNDLDMECINEEEHAIRKAMDNCVKDIPLNRQEIKINNSQLSIQNLQPSVKYNTTSITRNETNSVGSTSQGESTQNSRQSTCTNEKNLFNILPVEKYARKLTVFLTNTLEEMCQDIINSGCMQVAIHSLEKEIENLQEKHKKEILDIKQNADLIVKEMRSTIETEKQNAITEVRRQCEIEMRKSIEETKKKQWCANCGKEAVFYCCWNTSYCDYPCQQAHWPQHMSTCGQNHVTTVKEQLVTNMPNLGPEMTITQSPAIHGNLPVRIQFSGLHNQTQITQQANKQKNKKKCQFPVDQMTSRRKNGNINLSQSPTASIQQADVRLSPHPSTQILGANYTLQGGQVIPVSLQHSTPHPKQCAPTSTIEMKSHSVHPMTFPFNQHVCM